MRSAVITAALIFAAGIASPASAGPRASVSLSIHFEVAPRDLLLHRMNGRDFRGCKRLAGRITLLWQGRKQAPRIACHSHAKRPLVVRIGERYGSRLVARP